MCLHSATRTRCLKDELAIGTTLRECVVDAAILGRRAGCVRSERRELLADWPGGRQYASTMVSGIGYHVLLPECILADSPLAHGPRRCGQRERNDNEGSELHGTGMCVRVVDVLTRSTREGVLGCRL